MGLFVPNQNFEAEAAQDDEIREGLATEAKVAVPMVEAAVRDAGAPWMPRSGHETIEVQTDDEGVYLVNTDHAGHLMEFGSIRNPPFAPLRRGALAAGLRIEETPKP